MAKTMQASLKPTPHYKVLQATGVHLHTTVEQIFYLSYGLSQNAQYIMYIGDQK